jgi:hypothetical protein
LPSGIVRKKKISRSRWYERYKIYRTDYGKSK